MSSRGRLPQPEITARHHILLRAFERLNEDGDSWMYILSGNDPDVIIEITNRPREGFSVYCYGDKENWISLSPTRVAGMSDGYYCEIFYENIADVQARDKAIQIDGEEFWCPKNLTGKFQELIELVLRYIRTGVLPTVH